MKYLFEQYKKDTNYFTILYVENVPVNAYTFSHVIGFTIEFFVS